MTETQADQTMRRRAIASSMQKASEFVSQLAIAGELVLDEPPLSEILAEFDLLTRDSLSRFRPGEEEVAWWSQVELYAGIAEPLTLLRKGEVLTAADGSLHFTPPRFFKLADWAEGISLGPRFRGQESTAPANVDTLREELVVPFSEAPVDMIWAPLLDWRTSETPDS